MPLQHSEIYQLVFCAHSAIAVFQIQHAAIQNAKNIVIQLRTMYLKLFSALVSFHNQTGRDMLKTYSYIQLSRMKKKTANGSFPYVELLNLNVYLTV